VPAGHGGNSAGKAFVLVSVVLPLLYWFAHARESAPFVAVAATAQVAGIAWLLSARWPTAYRTAALAIMLAAAVALVMLIGIPFGETAAALGGISHAVAYAGLLVWFGLSMRPGCEPCVTGFARRVRLTMPAKVIRYTRRVTLAWCAFFAAQLVASAVLLVTAPPTVWAAFVNLFNLPLVAAMMLAEFGVRLILFRHEPRPGLADSVAALRRTRQVPGDWR
jgi:uncharacterized membrane protein